MKGILTALCVAILILGSAGHVRADDGSSAGTDTRGPAQPIDINSATPEQLTEIPGIGTAIAQRIVEFREKEGPFRKVEDLMKVRGIGEKSFQKIRPYVKVGKEA